ncbi:Spo0B domain-containing protein [Planococcus ruber]|uniref:Spo0B domain-containing protein n=1 Tax=Planococcus ruber TaxID=2027871 RepID=UPI001FEDF69D|nr:Spo0B domain-containing protein [Planococcus ruber]MCJ1908706.1 Spo0B domain-containing protein [Planococcus ruber]
MKTPMTVAQSLRHARHDFLNELQLIKMNLDLGRLDEVQAIIRTHGEAAVQMSRLSGLKMEKLEEWLLLSQWRYPEFRFHLSCQAVKAPVHLDGLYAETIEALIEAALGDTDPYEEYECFLTFLNEDSYFIAEIRLTGEWTEIAVPETEFEIVKACGPDGLNIAIRAQMEG